jgi:twitching motility protein PilT
VFSTLHTNSAADAIDRMIDVFPPHQQQQVRVQLSGVLEGVIAQQLLPRGDTNGRIAAFEVLLANSAIRNLIREGKAFQIPSTMQTSKKEGMQTMDDAIVDIYNKGQVDAQTAIIYAHDADAMRRRVRMY